MVVNRVFVLNFFNFLYYSHDLYCFQFSAFFNIIAKSSLVSCLIYAYQNYFNCFFVVIIVCFGDWEFSTWSFTSFAILLTNRHYFIFSEHLFKSTIVINLFNKFKLCINRKILNTNINVHLQ